jgi:outer membrane usher protein
MTWARVHTLLLAAVMFGMASGTAAQNTRPDVPAATPAQDRIIPLEATVNGARAGAWPFVERQGALYVTPDALQEWRIQIPAGTRPIRMRGNDFYPLAAIPGFTARINHPTLSVDLTFSPEAFDGTRLEMEKELRKPKRSPVLPSTFLNYDLNYQTSSARGGRTVQDLGALLELGASNEWGVFTTTHVGRNLTSDPSGMPKAWLRLESTFTHDLPDRNISVRLGDTSTRAGLWGRNVYFGGLQIGTNFGLSPGFLTQPLPLLSGISAAPSTVELYVNDVLRQTTKVPTGPFVIENASGLTGSGEARLVVRDVLGREVVIVQPFFTTVQLLAPGLDDWSFELGTVRENLGLDSNEYGSGFTSGLWRRGITDRLTLEGRAELSKRQRTGGIGALYALPGDILARAALAHSRHERAAAGNFALLGIEKQWVRASLTAQFQTASRGYRELGMADNQYPIRRQLAANFNYYTGLHSFGFGLARVERYDAGSLTTLSLNYGLHLPNRTTLNAYLSKALGGGTSFGLNLQVPMEDQRYVSANYNRYAGTQDIYATASQFAGETHEVGWRVLAGRLGNEAHAEGGLDYAGRYGRAYGDVSASPSQNSLRIGGSGGMAVAAHRFFFTKRLDDSFAIVELKGYPGIGVGLGSTVLTKTDESGIAFIPYLSAYQANQVRLDPRDLPISAEVDSIERLVVPSWRSAVKVDFPVRGGRSALVKIHDEKGEPLPPGSTVHLRGDKEEFYVGRRGEAFLTGLQPSNQVEARTREAACTFELQLPESDEEVLRIGPLTCRRKP